MVEFNIGDRVILNRDVVNQYPKYGWVELLLDKDPYNNKEFTISQIHGNIDITNCYRYIDQVWLSVNNSCGGPYPQCFFLPYNVPLSHYSKSGYKDWEAKQWNS